MRIHILPILLMLAVSACGGQRAVELPGAVEDRAGLIEALRAAGAQVEPNEPVSQVFLAAEGQIIKVNDADVQVFEYDSPGAMEADAAQVAPDGGSVGTTMITWIATPHFFKSGRILVLYIGEDVEILNLLEGALGAQFAGR